MKEINFPRRIDEVVILSKNLGKTLHNFRTVFHHEEWQTDIVTGANGTPLLKQAVNVMGDQKALRVIEPIADGTIYQRFLIRFGPGLFGVRERIPDEFFEEFRTHLSAKGIPMTLDQRGVLWADFSDTLGGFYGFIKQSAPAYPELDRAKLRQFCIVSDSVERTAQVLSEYLLLGPTEVGHSNSETVTNAVNSQYPDGLPDFEFLTGMLFYENMEFEIVEPKHGPLPYFDFINRRGTSFHHIKTEVPDGQWESTLAYYDSLNIKEALRGQIGTCRFSNLLTEDMLGFIYELSDGAPMAALPEGYDPYFYPLA